MVVRIYCKNCGQEIDEKAELCPKCGVHVKPVPITTKKKSPIVAVIASFFFPGLGQIYNGQMRKGILFIIIGIIFALLMFAFIGLILFPLFWAYNLYDAAKTAEKINRLEFKNAASGYLATTNADTLIRPDEHVEMTLKNVNMRRHVSFTEALAKGMNAAANKPRDPMSRAAWDRNSANRRALESFDFDEIVVTDKRILGSGGGLINTIRGVREIDMTTRALGLSVIGVKDIEFIKSFIVFTPEFSEALIEDFRKTRLPQIEKAFEEIDYQQPKGLFKKILAGYSPKNWKKAEETRKILYGHDLYWNQLTKAEIKTSGVVFKEEYLSLTIVPVLNTAYAEISKLAMMKANNAGWLSKWFIEKQFTPSKKPTVIDLRSESNEDLRKLYQILREKLSSSANPTASLA